MRRRLRWKVAVPAAAGASVLALVLMLSLSRRSPSEPGSSWPCMLPDMGVRACLDWERIRNTALGTALIEAIAAESGAGGDRAAGVWQALSGRSEYGSVDEIFIGVRLPGRAYPTGQIVIVLRGAFPADRLHQALVQADLVSFTRTIGGRSVHRLRMQSAVPPEIIFADEHHVIVCDAQSSAELIERGLALAGAAPAGDGKVAWAHGRLRAADDERLRLLLPPKIAQLGIAADLEVRGDTLIVSATLEPDGPAGPLATAIEELLSATLPPATAGGGEDGPAFPSHQVEERDGRVAVRLVAGTAFLKSILGRQQPRGAQE